MHLSTIGEIVKIEWVKTFEMRLDMNLDKGEFVIMPNHFHAIIFIGKNEYNINQLNERNRAGNLLNRKLKSDHNQKIWHR